MKLLLPVATVTLAAGFCCCGGDFEKVLREAGIDPGSSVDLADGRATFAVPSGHQVRITDVSTEDAYYADRAAIIGQICVTDGASSYNGDGWQGGSVKDCGNGSTYYFYKAAYVDLGAAPAAAVVPGVAAAPGIAATVSLPNGSRVKILDIHSEDAYYADRASMIGVLCTLGEDSSLKDVMWHGGSVSCDNGGSYYFYKASYEAQGAAAAAVTPSAPSAAPSGVATYPVPSGSRVKIADIHSEDAYYSTRSSVIGKTCTLDEDSSFKDGSWHGGPAHCDGESYYFYKAAYKVLGGADSSPKPAAAPSGVATYPVPSGSRVKSADIHSEDAYYSTRSSVIGKTCTLDETSSFKDGSWHGGPAHCGGESYYFYKAAYTVLGDGGGGSATAAPAAAGGRQIKRSIREGRRFKISDISTEDAYYNDRSGIIGKVCTAQEQSTFREPNWHGGSVSCDDGSTYYFFKAAYSPLGADSD